MKNRKNINYCIVVPRLTEIVEQYYTFPIGIAYVSASLKAAGYSVTVCNLNYKEGKVTDLLAPIFRDHQIDVLATGGLTAQYWQLKEIIDAGKALCPNIITCVGGGIITSDPEAGMEALETVDYGIVGEGEITICELAEFLEGGRQKENVAGLIYRDSDGDWTQMSIPHYWSQSIS